MKTAAALPILFGLALPLAAADGSFDKTIPIPRDGDAELDWTHEGCSVESLTLRNLPDEEEIEEARTKDPKDKHFLWWEFNVSNRGPAKCRIRLVVEVLDGKGAVIKTSDRTDTVSAGELDDDIRVPTLMKTLDVADAAKVRIRAEVGSKK